jgi:hypothetical protein
VVRYKEAAMKTLFCAFLLLTGCGGTVLLVHPKTGERITCRSASGHPVYDSIQTSGCAGQYEALGFVRAENLTPEQKEMISKPTAQRLEQSITIRQDTPER